MVHQHQMFVPFVCIWPGVPYPVLQPFSGPFLVFFAVRFRGLCCHEFFRKQRFPADQSPLSRSAVSFFNNKQWAASSPNRVMLIEVLSALDFALVSSKAPRLCPSQQVDVVLQHILVPPNRWTSSCNTSVRYSGPTPWIRLPAPTTSCKSALPPPPSGRIGLCNSQRSRTRGPPLLKWLARGRSGDPTVSPLAASGNNNHRPRARIRHDEARNNIHRARTSSTTPTSRKEPSNSPRTSPNSPPCCCSSWPAPCFC